MAVYPLAQIPIPPQAERLLIKQTQSFQSSGFSGAQAVIRYFSSWTLEVNWARFASASAADALAAWLDQLEGSTGTFTWRPTTGRLQVPTSIALDAAAYPDGNVIRVHGFAPGQATGLRVGGYMQIGSQLLRINAASSAADNGGLAQIEFAPRLRAQYPLNTHVETAAPQGLFRLADGSEGSGYQIDPDRLPDFAKLNALEYIS